MSTFSRLLLLAIRQGLAVLKTGEGAKLPHAAFQDNEISLSKERRITVGGILLQWPPISTDPEHQWVQNFVHSTASSSFFSECYRNHDTGVCIHGQGHVTGHRHTHSQAYLPR